MRRSTADKVNAGFTMALGVIAIIGVASISGIQRFAATTQDVSETHAALTELQSVLLSLADAERAQRGFIITGDPAYLEPVDSLSSLSIRQIHALREKTYADPDQQHRLSMLAAHVATRTRLIAEIADVRSDAGLDAAAVRVRTGEGRTIMDSIQTLARTFEQHELERLAARAHTASRHAMLATVLIAGGGIFAFIVVLTSGTLIRRDYTERRRAELALRDSETLLSQFMENLPIGVIVVDTQWRPRFANNAAVDILGPTVLIDDGAHPLPLYRARDRRVYPIDRTPLALALNGQTTTIDDAEVRVDDRYVPVQLSAAPIYDASGRIAYTIAAFIDITERHRAEAALRAAKDAAETASRTKSDFLARMSHELRTPLNSVIGFANILLKNKAGNLRGQDTAYLDRIQDNGRHLLLLINDILDLSKIEAGRIEVESETLDLGQLIRDVAQHFDVQLRGRPVRLKLQIPDGMAPLVSDSARLRQVLNNLIGNAVKFTEKGSITVAVDVDPDTARPARVRVSDTGIGIPEDRLGAIFDAFEQAESTTSRKYGGTGLGLPLSRALCELLGFSLTVRSRMQAGTEFTIDMTPHEARPEQQALPADDAAHQGGRTPGERLVLIVDDSADERRMLEDLLVDTAAEVRTAANGQEALRTLRDFEPDLVLLDMLMPIMDGLTFLEIFRATPRFRNVPVVVISAKDLSADETDRVVRHSAAVVRKGKALESELRRVLAEVLGSADADGGDA